MYHQYFGLSEAPFSIAVNPRYLFMSPRHRDALAHLLYGVGAGGGFILLTGEVGTGKTTINRCLLEQLPDDTDIAIILNPALNAIELLATVCDELRIHYDHEHHSLKTLTDELHKYLLENHDRGRKTVLLIDEAQHLEFDVLEQIRLLTNLETHSEKLLQIILIGQPELAQMLSRPELRQLNQRITARYNLEPLSPEETGAYIRHRLQVAGLAAGQEVFPATVVRGIHRYTRGIPRLINVLCDRMMLGAYSRNSARTDMKMLRLAAREVMGEEVVEPAVENARIWTVAAAVVAVLLVAILWWWRYAQDGGTELAISADAAAQTVDLLPVNPSATAEREQALELTAATLIEAEPEPQPKAETEPDADPSNWLLSPTAALDLLWSLYSAEPTPSDLCVTSPSSDRVCIEGEADTWNELKALDRPLLLEMITPERFGAAVVYLGSENRLAWILSEGGVQRVELARLGPLWTGRYRLLWNPPENFTGPLGLGDNSSAVASVARQFAQLDGQPQPLTQNKFTPALESRVRLFQRQQGLDDDGMVGVQTLLRLNEATGVDLTASAARQLLGSDTAEGDLP